jgi:hypothetical protein
MSLDRLRVYFTIDTETSLGGAWRQPKYAPLPLDLMMLGKYGNRSFGIPLMMDILEEYSLRGTFFVEVFCSYIMGEAALKPIFRMILERGHDAQLHLHPIFRFYRDALRGDSAREMDMMWQMPAAEQHALIGEGASLFRVLSGRAPRAYRAGGYGASEVTLTALRDHGISIDSSYNLAYLGKTCGFDLPMLNAPAMISGVHEFPITVFRVPGAAGFKPLEISAVSVPEILRTLHTLRVSGCRDAVLVLHSFSFLKSRSVRWDDCSPDRIVIRRFRNLCSELSKRSAEYEVRTLGDVELSSPPLPQPQMVPSMGWVRPAVRKVVQGVNSCPWI